MLVYDVRLKLVRSSTPVGSKVAHGQHSDTFHLTLMVNFTTVMF